MANTSMKVVLKMLFLTLSNADIWFAKKKLVWRTYSAAEALFTIQKGEIINKKKFAATALNKEDEIFVVYMAAFSIGSNDHSSQQAQIALLDVKKVIISSEYTNYINVFSPDSMAKLPKYTGINNHSIDFIGNKQLLYNLIYSLRLVELEMLKIYIKINRTNGFIKSSKSSTSA